MAYRCHEFLRILPAAGFALFAALPAAAQLSPLPSAPVSHAAPALPPVADPVVDLLRVGADGSDRMTLPVEIGDEGPYPFIIDTGSHRSIVATELAQRLALAELPPVRIISMAGAETVDAVHLEAMRFGTQTISDLPVLSIAHHNLGSAGLIGLDGLKDKRVTLDFKAREMSVVDSKSATRVTSDENVVVVRARSRLGQLILVNAHLDGRRVNVILDTGAEYSVGNMALYEKLKVKRLVVPPEPIEIRSVTGQPIQAIFTVVRRLQIDGAVLNNIPMVFLDAEPFAELGLDDEPSMLLGMRMLRMFDRVAIDFGKRHIDFMLPKREGSTVPQVKLFAAR